MTNSYSQISKQHTLPIVCADVGAYKNLGKTNFGWCSSELAKEKGEEGACLMSLVDYVVGLLNQNKPVALGFECPLFVPLGDEQQNLTRARDGEGNRPWSAGAGCAVLATGLVQVAWILKKIKALTSDTKAYLDWDQFDKAESGLFIWEAFVSAEAKNKNKKLPLKEDQHIADARSGCSAFKNFVKHDANVEKISLGKIEVYSLIGAALLRTGWSDDLSLLSKASCAFKAPAT